MPPSNSQLELKKRIEQLRLLVSRRLYACLKITLPLAKDISYQKDIAELCDRYCLSIIANWLAGKYKLPAYSQDMSSDPETTFDVTPFIIDSWSCLSDRYPFDPECFSLISINERLYIWDLAKEFLEKNVQPDIFLLAAVYEHINANPLAISAGGDLYIKKDLSRRLTGLFYTPQWVVNYCFSKVQGQAHSRDSSNLSRFIMRIKAGEQTGSSCQLSDDEQFRIIDPACGCGNFLLGACQWYHQRQGTDAREKLSFASQALFGVDIDQRAIAIARLSLVIMHSQYLLEAAQMALVSPALDAKKLKEEKQRRGKETLKQELEKFVLALNNHIKVGDLLSDSTFNAEPESESKQYDLVITNPPYISYGSRNQPKPPFGWQEYFRQAFPAASEYKLRMHSLFQELSVKLCRPGGRIVLFLPDAFLTGAYYQKLRQFLYRQVNLDSFDLLPDKTISDACVGKWLVCSYQKKEGESGAEKAVSISRMGSEGNVAGSVPLNLFVSPDKFRFRLLFDTLDQKICAKLDEMPALHNWLKGHTGMRSRHGQKAIIGRSEKEGVDRNWKRGIVSGSCISRQSMTWDGSWLDVTPKLLWSGGYDSQVVENAKIMVRQTADRIVCAVDCDGLYHLNNVHSFSAARVKSYKPILDRALSDLYFFSALMNSRLWLYLYLQKSGEEDRPLAQIDIEMLECMPVPLSHLTSTALETAAEIAQLSQRQHRRAEQSGSVEPDLDGLIYKLYCLSEEEIHHLQWRTAESLRKEKKAGRKLKNEGGNSSQNERFMFEFQA